MKIGELAAQAAIPVETIRYYEREGLLPVVGRSGSNYRIYDPDHLARLNFIRNCRALDMTLSEIRTLLRYMEAPEQDCGDVNDLLDDHLAHVQQRIGELQQLETELVALRSRCQQTREAAHCGILQQLSRPSDRPRTTGSSHVARTHDLDRP